MKRHRFDPFSFLFGALFVTVGATFLFGSTRVGDVHPARLWPAALAVVGATLALSAAARLLRLAAEAVPDTDEGAPPPDVALESEPEPAEPERAAELEPDPVQEPGHDRTTDPNPPKERSPEAL